MFLYLCFDEHVGRQSIGEATSTNNMNLNSSIGSQNSISNDSQENIGNAARGQSIQGRLAGTSIGNYFLITKIYLFNIRKLLHFLLTSKDFHDVQGFFAYIFQILKLMEVMK